MHFTTVLFALIVAVVVMVLSGHQDVVYAAAAYLPTIGGYVLKALGACCLICFVLFMLMLLRA